MKVFLGWSGETSHKVALALNDWLPKVIQAVKPFVSSEDIAKGARWSLAIAKELQASSFGIICVTKENSDSAWINFEAGALSREIETSLVTPFLFDLREAEIEGPLKQFQVVINEGSDILKLLTSINNKQSESRLEETNLKSTFEMWWPRLKEQLEAIQQEAGKKPALQTRSTLEMVEELLELTRMQLRERANQSNVGADLEQARFVRQMTQFEQVSATLSALTRSVESLHVSLTQRGQIATLSDLLGVSEAPAVSGGTVWGNPFQPPPAPPEATSQPLKIVPQPPLWPLPDTKK